MVSGRRVALRDAGNEFGDGWLLHAPSVAFSARIERDARMDCQAVVAAGIDLPLMGQPLLLPGGSSPKKGSSPSTEPNASSSNPTSGAPTTSNSPTRISHGPKAWQLHAPLTARQ
jgi:hypothetical protein